MIVGKSIYLTELDRENIDAVRGWLNDPEVNEWMLTGHLPITRGQEQAFYDANDTTTDAHRFEIHRADDGKLLGICGLEGVSMIHRHAEAGIFIGDTSEHDRGLGSDALTTLIGFAFRTLGLQTVQIRYVDGNERAAHLYPKLGFKQAGRLRSLHYLRGEFHDSVLLDMTRDDFERSQG